MNLPKFRVPTMALTVILVVVVLLGVIVLWFSKIPAYQRPLGLFAATYTCEYTKVVQFGTDAQTVSINLPGSSQTASLNVEGYAQVDQNNDDYCAGVQIDSHLHINSASLGGGSWRLTVMPGTGSSGEACNVLSSQGIPGGCPIQNAVWTSGVMGIQSNVAREYGEKSPWLDPANYGWSYICNFVYEAVWSPPASAFKTAAAFQGLEMLENPSRAGWGVGQFSFEGGCPGLRGNYPT
jgi:hypothetical protein